MTIEQSEDQKKLEVAYHEAGHAVMALTYGLNIKRISLVGTAEYRGVTSLEPFERKNTIEHADREISLNLAGFVGALGIDRTFVMCPKNFQSKIPSDLAGYSLVPYATRRGISLEAMVCDGAELI